MASPYDYWRNNYGVPGPQDPNRPGEISASPAPRWEEILRGSDVSAIKQNPIMQALGRYLSKPSAGVSETTRVSPIDGRPMAPEPGAMDKLPPTVQEGIGGLGLLANFLAPGVKLPPLAPKPTGIRAYHGSPHDFDRFDISKINTGEGAQAYGHGLYFAESENVAKGYRDKLKKDNRVNSATDRFMNLEVDGQPLASRFDIDPSYVAELKGLVANGDQAAIAGWLQQKRARWQQMEADPAYPFRDYAVGKSKSYGDLIDYVNKGGAIRDAGAGRMYEVNIKADPELFLDWDLPLGQQSAAVREAVERLPQTEVYTPGKGVTPLMEREGDAFYGALAEALGRPYDPVTRRKEWFNNEAASKALREAGIPGIRYKDSMSRGADGGTSNYVVFDDKMIEILRKYGLLPPAIAAGAAMSEQEPPL